jgi:hypothetical protein
MDKKKKQLQHTESSDAIASNTNLLQVNDLGIAQPQKSALGTVDISIPSSTIPTVAFLDGMEEMDLGRTDNNSDVGVNMEAGEDEKEPDSKGSVHVPNPQKAIKRFVKRKILPRDQQTPSIVRSFTVELILSLILTPVVGILVTFWPLHKKKFSKAGLVGGNSVCWMLYSLPLLVSAIVSQSGCSIQRSIKSCDARRCTFTPDPNFDSEKCFQNAQYSLMTGCILMGIGCVLGIASLVFYQREERARKGEEIPDE